MAAQPDSLRHLLLDPDYWRPRLDRLRQTPRQLVQIPRQDLSRPGCEVLELRLRAHDGARLVALLARSAFHSQGAQVHLRLCDDMRTAALDWRAVDEGASDLVLQFPQERRLEDRVLDVLRIVHAVCSIEGVDCSSVRFSGGIEHAPDEFAIADLFRSRGWV